MESFCKEGIFRIFKICEGDHFIMLVDHIEILEQWKNLKGVEDLTNNDLTVAVGGALMGSDNFLIKMREKMGI